MTRPTRPMLALLVAALLAAPTYALLLAGGSPEGAEGGTPVAGSENVSLIGAVPGTAAISGVFSRSAPYFYVSGIDSVSVIDVSDPRAPKLAGKLVNAVFENEAMTLGERRKADGSIQRFVLVGNDLGQVTVSPSGARFGRVGGQQLTVVDVTDPANPQIAGQTPTSGDGAATTSTHTVACMNAACSVAYTAGDGEGFSILDLTDLAKPREIRTVASPAGRPNPVFSSGAGHHWNVDGAGVAWHTGAGGTAGFDVTDPLEPKLLTGTDANGTKSPYNDFIHHNSQRPNARAFAPGKPVGVQHGNVVLVTEEDYANDGDEVVCDRAGTFQTWEVQDLDGERYRRENPGAEANKGTMRPLDTINPPAESGGGLSLPAGTFCSAHWFDYHQSGVIAQGFYQQGLRLIDVRDPRDLKQFGYFTGGATEVWDAYWAPERGADGTVIPGRKTNLVYTVDVVHGVQVFEVSDLPDDLPVSGDVGDRGTFPAAPARATETPAADGATQPGAAPTALAGSRACGLPTSRVTRSKSRLRSTRATLRGTAQGNGCKVAAVSVAIGRKTGDGCRFLQSSGRFGAKRSCRRTQYVAAKGTASWAFDRKVKLPRGRYLVWSRAIGETGRTERKAAARNLLRASVR